MVATTSSRAPVRAPGQVVQQLDRGQAGRCAGRRARAASGRSAASPRSTWSDGLVTPAGARTPALPRSRARGTEHGRPAPGIRPTSGGCARTRPAPAAGSRGMPVSGRVQRVDERLQEQRPLAGVAAAVQHTVRRSAATTAASSAASRVLPMPPSPASSTTAGRAGAGRDPGGGEPGQLRGAARPGPGGRRRGPRSGAPPPGSAGRARASSARCSGAGRGCRVDAQLGEQRRAQPLVTRPAPGSARPPAWWAAISQAVGRPRRAGPRESPACAVSVGAGGVAGTQHAASAAMWRAARSCAACSTRRDRRTQSASGNVGQRAVGRRAGLQRRPDRPEPATAASPRASRPGTRATSRAASSRSTRTAGGAPRRYTGLGAEHDPGTERRRAVG